MTNELFSKKTRNEFREFLVGWTLREIEAEFEAAHIDCDRSYEPQASGQRRSFVEQHYHTLDFTKPADVRRLVTVFESVLERSERQLPSACDREASGRAIEGLKVCLLRDGFKYQDGQVLAAAPETRIVFEDSVSGRTISEVTRRAIFDELRVRGTPWAGALHETEFLSKLYDLSGLPSFDGRFKSMIEDIWQHRENNYDWPDDWVFSDSRFDLLHAPDQAFLRFLRELLHPVTRPDSNEANDLATLFNRHLAADEWELAEGKRISGKPTFVARRRFPAHVALPDREEHSLDVLSDEYIRELSGKCDARLAADDFDGAITIGRTLLEAILGELEVRLAGVRNDYKGDLPKQFKQVAKLLRMDDQRPDLDDRFKDVIRGLVMVANGLAPLRNKMSDGHARERKPAPHHARVVVNAAKTVAVFLVESYIFQNKKGLLRA